jgi:hypothetical protein
MIDRLAIGLTGDPAFPVYHFHMPVQHQGNGFVNAGSIVWKDGFGFVGDLQDGFPEGDLSRGCRVLGGGRQTAEAGHSSAVGARQWHAPA